MYNASLFQGAFFRSIYPNMAPLFTSIGGLNGVTSGDSTDVLTKLEGVLLQELQRTAKLTMLMVTKMYLFIFDKLNGSIESFKTVPFQSWTLGNLEIAG